MIVGTALEAWAHRELTWLAEVPAGTPCQEACQALGARRDAAQAALDALHPDDVDAIDVADSVAADRAWYLGHLLSAVALEREAASAKLVRDLVDPSRVKSLDEAAHEDALAESLVGSLEVLRELAEIERDVARIRARPASRWIDPLGHLADRILALRATVRERVGR